MISSGLVANLIWIDIIVFMLSFLYLLGLHIPLGCDIYSTYPFGILCDWVMFWHCFESKKSNMGAVENKV